MIVFKIHVKILSMYLKYYFKYMYFKILPITANNLFMILDINGTVITSLTTPHNSTNDLSFLTLYFNTSDLS